MTCHICRRTGQKTYSQEEAEIKCLICGYCELEKQIAEQEESKND